MCIVIVTKLFNSDSVTEQYFDFLILFMLKKTI